MQNVVISNRKYAVLFSVFAMVFLSLSAAAQSSAKVIAVISRADWCPVCQANGKKIMQEVIPACKNLQVHFVINDLTNDKTIARSKKILEKQDVENAVEDLKSTGVIILVDNKTKKVLQTISFAEPTDKIVQTIKAAQG